nr:MAG TPA: hypothetical protein [Caudoviricetes sp.]
MDKSSRLLSGHSGGLFLRSVLIWAVPRFLAITSDYCLYNAATHASICLDHNALSSL